MAKINIAELLKDCPTGMELDCTMYDNVTFGGISNGRTIVVIRRTVNQKLYLDKYGCPLEHLKGDLKCVIFPKGKTTWEGFQQSFKDGDIVAITLNPEGTWVGIFKQYTDGFESYCSINTENEFCSMGIKNHTLKGVHLATESEKQKLFQAIKDNGYKWNEETKTLEKLIEPKFKVGDRIKDKNNKIWFVVQISDKHFDISLIPNAEGYFVSIEDQDDYELIPNKFDINTLVPFKSEVLVRNSDSGFWKPAFWGIYEAEKTNEHQYRNYLTTEGFVRHCIPYNDETKHLLGKTDNCNEYYKTWK